MNMDIPRVLVVDDEEDNCRNLSDILGDLGCHVQTANDGPSALELLRRTSFDVALLDLKMPGMDGLSLCRALKKLRTETVAIIVTAYASPATAVEAIEAGAVHVLAKPVELPLLLKKVDEAAGKPLVLVVDDDRDLCANLADLFSDRGYRVALAHSEDDASARLAEAAFRVVLIDMKLPGGSGDGVFRNVRNVSPGARTVLITGHRAETDELIGKVLEAGADAVCYKPFNTSELLNALDALAAITRPKRSDGSSPP
jgi:two-component system, NtrC family, response regulator HydG